MLTRLMNNARAAASDRRGLTTVEYVIVLCLIAAAAVGAWQEFGAQVVDDWLGSGRSKIDTEINGEGIGGP